MAQSSTQMQLARPTPGTPMPRASASPTPEALSAPRPRELLGQSTEDKENQGPQLPAPLVVKNTFIELATPPQCHRKARRSWPKGFAPQPFSLLTAGPQLPAPLFVKNTFVESALHIHIDTDSDTEPNNLASQHCSPVPISLTNLLSPVPISLETLLSEDPPLSRCLFQPYSEGGC